MNVFQETKQVGAIINKNDKKTKNTNKKNQIKQKNNKPEEIVYGTPKNEGPENPEELKIFVTRTPFSENLSFSSATPIQEQLTVFGQNFDQALPFSPEALLTEQTAKLSEQPQSKENSPILQWKKTSQGIYLDSGSGHTEGTQNNIRKKEHKTIENKNKHPKTKDKKYTTKTKMTKQDDEQNKKIISAYSTLLNLENVENKKGLKENKNKDSDVSSSDKELKKDNLNGKKSHQSSKQNSKNKAYDDDHHIDSKKSGYHVRENFKDKEADKGKEQNGKHHVEDYITKLEESEKEHKKEKFLEKEGHKKGHKTRGYNNKFHRDELHREHKFYDDDKQMTYKKKKEEYITDKKTKEYPYAITKYVTPVQRVGNYNNAHIKRIPYIPNRNVYYNSPVSIQSNRRYVNRG